MEHRAITNKRTRYSTEAEAEHNSVYYWQYQVLLSLQPEILNQVYSYSRTINPINKALQTSETYKKRIPKDWFVQIGVQTPFSGVKELEIPLLWGLYQNRISNAPSKKLLMKAINNGLNRDYFFAKELYLDVTGSFNLLRDDIDEKELEKINVRFKNTIQNSSLRYGDILIFKNRQNGGVYSIYFIYDGKKLVLSEYNDNGFKIIPKIFPINNFPITSYFLYDFSYSIIGYSIYFNTQDTDIKLIEEYQISANNDKIYHYITTGKFSDYEIWMRTPLTKNNWKGILIFGSIPMEDTIPIKKINTDKYSEIFGIVYKNIRTNQNTRILFQNKNYQY